MLEFQTTLHVNRLIWISSLPIDEEGPTRRIVEDLEQYCSSIDLPFELHRPKNIDELRAILESVRAAATAGVGPILHFDPHGSKKEGLRIADSQESMPWNSLFQHLRAINIATQNNLCVVCLVCFGLHVIRDLEITEASPFYLLIAPEGEVSTGFIEEKTVEFYREVLTNSNIVGAYERHLAASARLFHSEKVLAIILGRYLLANCIGKAGDKRKERLLTEVFEAGLPNNRANKRRLRRSLKKVVRPGQDLVDRYSDNFLVGKRVNLDTDALMSLARGVSEDV